MGRNEKINTEAWDILTQDEKTAISLSLGHGKSTWESGEIMGRAHFKYLEIQKRARKFLEIFTNHFEIYNGLFPETVNISFAFKEYLNLTILDRKNISQAVKQMEDTSYSVTQKRNKAIVIEINKLRTSSNKDYIALYSLIMDFDRWNNFRILPLEVQEPSAFKRRNKARNVKHIKNITTLPQFSVLKIIQKFSYIGKYEKLYLPIVSTHLTDGYKVIDIRNKNTIVKDITDIGLFVFEDKEEANNFAILISDYFINKVKNCRTGQKFWPEFRIMSAKAFNFKDLENIHKSRTYLDKAIFDRDTKKHKTPYNNPDKGEIRAEDESIFYI